MINFSKFELKSSTGNIILQNMKKYIYIFMLKMFSLILHLIKYIYINIAPPDSN